MVGILCKIHKSGNNEVLAVCDKAVCGKTLKTGKIEFTASEFFYRGSEISEKELREKLLEFDNINIIGNKAVAIALREKIVAEENVIEIAGIKHVQIFKI